MIVAMLKDLQKQMTDQNNAARTTQQKQMTNQNTGLQKLLTDQITNFQK